MNSMDGNVHIFEVSVEKCIVFQSDIIAIEHYILSNGRNGALSKLV